MTLNDTTIGGDNVTILDNGNVSGDDFFDGDNFDGGRAGTGVTEDSSLGCTDGFEGCNSLDSQLVRLGATDIEARSMERVLAKVVAELTFSASHSV